MVRLSSTLLATLLPLSASIASAGPIGDVIELLKPKLTSKKLQGDIKVSALKAHVNAFQSFADKHNGTRFFGTPGYNASVDYVYSQSKKAGYDVKKQSLELLQSIVTVETLSSSVPINASTTIPVHALDYSPLSPAGGVSGALIAIPDTVKGENGTATPGCEAGDFAGLDVTGKVALIKRGACPFAQKSQNAKAAGAVAAIIYNNLPGDPLQGTLGDVNDTAYVPTGGVTLEIGELLVNAASSGNITVTLNLQFDRKNVWSSNVIATSKTGNQNKIIMIGGHLDSVAAGPGINDDGSGSIAVLELAKQIAKYSLKNKNAVRFAWWTAEEEGLLGSDYYVSQLSDAEKKKIALYINLDMVASPNYILGIDDSDNSAGNNTIGAGPPGSGAVEAVLQQYFTSKKLPTVPTAFDGRSDYASFIDNDIPASGLFTGAEEIKTPEQAKLFGGKAGEAFDPNYHGPGDTKENINYVAFEHMVKAAAHAIATFSESTKLVDDQKNGATTRRKRQTGETSTLRDDLGVVRAKTNWKASQ
ncbi:Leucyl aminopeptidase yscIV [Tulasnella sp. 418]|nr:Leucyl aminopeptidase yscIV [Tulasnella sp. 418]